MKHRYVGAMLVVMAVGCSTADSQPAVEPAAENPAPVTSVDVPATTLVSMNVPGMK